MARTFLFPIALTLCLLAYFVSADRTPPKNLQLVGELKMMGTQPDRLDRLPSDPVDWTFDFHVQEGYTFNPGSVINANVASFPTALGNKLTMAMIQLGPCGMLPPHFHPRASNYVLAVQGTTHTCAVEENDARVMQTVLDPGKMTIFPQGAIHTMMNRECQPAQLVAALADEDSGTTNLLNNLFRLPEDFVTAAFGNRNLDVNETAGMVPKIGSNGVPGAYECYQRCGIPYPVGYSN